MTHNSAESNDSEQFTREFYSKEVVFITFIKIQ